jgi:hypothetical protein
MQLHVLIAVMAVFSDKAHMRAVRTRLSLTHCLAIHHVLPREHAALLPAGVGIDDPENLIFMMTSEGKRTMNVRSTRLVHDGDHVAYNSYVGHELWHLKSRGHDAAGVRYLRDKLRHRLRKDDPSLPWN